MFSDLQNSKAGVHQQPEQSADQTTWLKVNLNLLTTFGKHRAVLPNLPHNSAKLPDVWSSI